MSGKYNHVRGKVLNGQYKDKMFDIEIGRTPYETKVMIDGKKVEGVQSILIRMDIDKPLTTMHIVIQKGDGDGQAIYKGMGNPKPEVPGKG